MAQKSYDKALFRLISILSMLVKDERPTISSLAEEFNVSKRTIQTDIYQRLCGWDITKDKFGRLVFMDGYNATKYLSIFHSRLDKIKLKITKGTL